MSKVKRPLAFHTRPIFSSLDLNYPEPNAIQPQKRGQEQLPWPRLAPNPRPLSSDPERHTPSRTDSTSTWPAGTRGNAGARWGQASIPMGLLTWHVDIPEAGEGGIEAGTFLPVGPVFLHGLTHLLICHLQEVLQTQLARADLLAEGREKEGNQTRSALRPPCRPLVVSRGTPGSGWTLAWDCCLGVRQAQIRISALPPR